MQKTAAPLHERVLDIWRIPEKRRLFGRILGGKMIGVALVFGVIAALGVSVAHAQDATDTAAASGLTVDDLINPINTMWTLVAAFLVFFMQAGFMALEAGFARERETNNIMLECIIDTCLCGILFWAFGFAFMFGSGNGFIGHEFFFLNGAPETYGTTGVAFPAFFLFQFAFADTCSTITSGAMVGRTGFVGDLLYSIGVSGFIYPILGHWIWGPDGWLYTMNTPMRDFAGSTVVHTVGGFIALAGAIALGPRIGRKFKRDGGGMPPGHSMTLAAVGAVILWFGWYGFNPGSTLSALDMGGMARVATNTTLAACAGGIVAMFLAYPSMKKWDTGLTINGFLAGLVAITAPCYFVNQLGAVVIGSIAAVVMYFGVKLLEYVRIDDPVGAVPVHGLCGIWGTLAIGLFATGAYSMPSSTGPDATVDPVVGLFYGGGLAQLKSQAIGSFTVTVVCFAVAMGLMYLVKATGTLRVSREGEIRGIDIHEHGAPSYHMEVGAGTGYYIAPGPDDYTAVDVSDSATVAQPTG
ncbi:MAG: ammonium transporter [Acidimicrobiia bacterium]|nr:ammonium transporter [Acidimicrobiia bacterium]